jgi:hypothetical protein
MVHLTIDDYLRHALHGRRDIVKQAGFLGVVEQDE